MTPRAATSPWFLTSLQLAAIAAGGLLCVIAPTLVAGKPLKPAPLFSLLRTSIEGLSWQAPVLLAVLGISSGILTRLRPVWIGLASIAALPAAAIAEIVADSTSHNLIPIELVMYLLLSLPALAGALLWRAARGLSRRFTSPKAP